MPLTEQSDRGGGALSDLVYPKALLPAERSRAAAMVTVLPTLLSQQVLDEWAGIIAAGEIRASSLGCLRALVRRAQQGTFAAERALRVAQARKVRQRAEAAPAQVVLPEPPPIDEDNPLVRRALVKLWFDQGLSIGTLKNRMAVIRWWAQRVDKQNVVARSNAHYGIPDRRFVTNASKAKTVTRVQLDKVRDQHVRMSLELQQAFGLRREEAIKFQPGFADRGDHLVLKSSWTKGGRERTIPIRTEAQRDVLNRARRLAGFGSLIPSHRNYVQQLRIYEGNTLRAGLSNMHGLRHAYAQNRYEELTGWLAPAAGGPKAKTLTPEQRETDRETRLTISRELGHERASITAAYCG